MNEPLKQIAVIEDNPDNRLLVRVILEPHYRVTEYESGYAALEGLRNQLPEVILLDVSLPEMDGAEVLRRIRADARLRLLPVIALTAHAMSGDREKFLSEGFDDYVSKPIVDEMLLLDAIAKLVSRNPAPSSSAPAGESRSLDATALQRLLRLGGEAFAAQMIDLFLDYAGAKIAEARAAQVAGDSDGLAKAVHPLKSSAGNVGAARVQELATQLEALAQRTDAASLAPLLDELEQAFATVKRELQERRHNLKNPRTPGSPGSQPSPKI